MSKSLFGINVGIVVNFGGIIGQGETDDPEGILDGGLDLSDSWLPPMLGAGIAASVQQKAYALEEIKTAGVGGGLISNLALYVGPHINIGPFYITIGPCLGGFGCLAFGGGISIGSVGFGVLIPFWRWW